MTGRYVLPCPFNDWRYVLPCTCSGWKVRPAIRLQWLEDTSCHMLAMTERYVLPHTCDEWTVRPAVCTCIDWKVRLAIRLQSVEGTSCHALAMTGKHVMSYTSYDWKIRPAINLQWLLFSYLTLLSILLGIVWPCNTVMWKHKRLITKTFLKILPGTSCRTLFNEWKYVLRLCDRPASTVRWLTGSPRHTRKTTFSYALSMTDEYIHWRHTFEMTSKPSHTLAVTDKIRPAIDLHLWWLTSYAPP